MNKIITTLLVAAACVLPSVGFAQSGTRIKANLNPVISVDASGKAVLDRRAGTGNDRFTSEVEIAKADFDVLKHHA